MSSINNFPIHKDSFLIHPPFFVVWCSPSIYRCRYKARPSPYLFSVPVENERYRCEQHCYAADKRSTASNTEGVFNGDRVKGVTVLDRDKGWRKFGDNLTEMDTGAVANERRFVSLQRYGRRRQSRMPGPAT